MLQKNVQFKNSVYNNIKLYYQKQNTILYVNDELNFIFDKYHPVVSNEELVTIHNNELKEYYNTYLVNQILYNTQQVRKDNRLTLDNLINEYKDSVWFLLKLGSILLGSLRLISLQNNKNDNRRIKEIKGRLSQDKNAYYCCEIIISTSPEPKYQQKYMIQLLEKTFNFKHAKAHLYLETPTNDTELIAKYNACHFFTKDSYLIGDNVTMMNLMLKKANVKEIYVHKDPIEIIELEEYNSRRLYTREIGIPFVFKLPCDLLQGDLWRDFIFKGGMYITCPMLTLLKIEFIKNTEVNLSNNIKGFEYWYFLPINSERINSNNLLLLPIRERLNKLALEQQKNTINENDLNNISNISTQLIYKRRKQKHAKITNPIYFLQFEKEKSENLEEKNSERTIVESLNGWYWYDENNEVQKCLETSENIYQFEQEIIGYNQYVVLQNTFLGEVATNRKHETWKINIHNPEHSSSPIQMDEEKAREQDIEGKYNT